MKRKMHKDNAEKAEEPATNKAARVTANATNSSGQFTDAPLTMTMRGPFHGSSLQDLRAVGPGGNVINLGTNSLHFSSSRQGQGLINIDNKKMNIHISAGTPP
jgi:hypothetical protein